MSIAFGSITLSCVNDGEPGRDGVGISSTVVEYAIGSSQTMPPEYTLTDGDNTVLVDEYGAILTDGQWESEMPVVPNGMYLWSRTITTYDDGTFSISYSVSRDGIGILTEKRQYYLSDSPTTLSGGSWVDEQPYPIPAGKYMWGRLEFKMTDGTITYSEAVYENTLSGIINKTDAIEGNIKQKIWQTDIESAIDDYDTLDGNTTVRERISEFYQDLNGIHTTIGDKTSSPSGILESLSKVSQTANKISWLVKSGDDISNMVLTDEAFSLISNNINLSGKITISAFNAATQQKFNNMETDLSNINIRDFKQEYGYSTSRTVQPAYWQTDVPAAAEGRYIWQKTTYSTKAGQSFEEVVCLTGQKGDTGAQGPAGASVTAYTLEVSHAAVVKAVNGSYNPSSITLTAKSKIGSSPASDYSGRFVIETSTDGSTWKNPPDYTSSINEANYNFIIPSGTVAIRCSLYASGGITTLLDQQTVPVVNDGANGGKGEDAYTIVLTNEAHTFMGNSSTVIPTSVNCGVIAYKGATQIAAHIGEITGKPSGLSTSIANNDTTTARFTVSVTSSLASNNGTLTIPIVADGKQFTKYFSYSVSLKGATGAQGPAGVSVTAYTLDVSHAAVAKAVNGSYNPSSITLNAKSKIGSSPASDYSGRFVIETSTNGSTWKNPPDYTSSINEANRSFTIPSGTVAIRCSLYAAGGITTLLDQQTVPVVNDGANGGKGEDAYTIILTNEAHTFMGNSSTVIPTSVNCGVIAYKGATQIAAHIGEITGKPSGLSTSIANNDTTTARFTVSVTSSLASNNGTLTIPVVADGKQFTKYFSYSVSLKGDTGAQGPAGRGIANTDIAYCVGESGTEAPGGYIIWADEDGAQLTDGDGAYLIESTWSATIPDVPDGSFLWVRKIETYSDGSSTTSYSVARSGVSGGDAYTVMLTNESHTFLGAEDHAVGGTVEFEVAAYKGANRIETTIGNISNISGGSSVTVTGMTATVTGNGTKTARISVTVTDKMKNANGILYIPITVDGNIFTKEFTYSVAFKGKDGKDAKVRYLEVSNVAIVRDSNGTYTPNYIQVGAKERSGTSAVIGYSGRFKIETTENFTNWTARYTTPNDVSAYIYSDFPENIKAIRCGLYEAGGTTVLLDQQTVAIVENGSEGRGVASIEYYYCLSENKPVTNPIDDKVNWSTTPQKYDSVSKKYWTCTVTAYSDGSKVASAIVEDSGANSMNEYAMLAYQAAGTADQILKVWTKDANLTDITIEGGYLKAHTIDSERLKTDAIMSSNYDPYSGGKAAYNIALSNDMHTFTTGGSSTLINVVGYKGRTKVATRVALKNAAPSGMTCSISDNNTVNTKCTVITSSSFNGSGSLTFVVTVGSETEAYSVERTFTYNVSSVNRQLSLIYIVDTSSYPVSVIEKKTDNTFNPDNISVQSTAIPGGIYNGRLRIETTANIEDNPEDTYWASQYESSQDEFMYMYTTIPDKVKAIRFSLYASGGFTTLLDQQTVLVATDFAAFSGQGTYLDLATGNFYSPNFAVINTAPSDTGFGKGTYMGPWRVTEDAIWKISQKFKNSQANSAYFGNEGISITDKFSVDKTGFLETKKGKIGDWYIDDDNGYLRSADSTVVLSPKSVTIDNAELYAKIGAVTIDGQGYLTARQIYLSKWISEGNVDYYGPVLAPLRGSDLGINDETTYEYIKFGSYASAWIAAHRTASKLYAHAGSNTYELGDYLGNMFRRYYLNKYNQNDSSTYIRIERAQIYVVTFSHPTSNDSSGAFWFMGGDSTSAAPTVHTLIEASNITNNFFSSGGYYYYYWTNSTNTPTCYIYY